MPFFCHGAFFLTRCLFFDKNYKFCSRDAFFLTKIGNFVQQMPFFDAVPFFWHGAFFWQKSQILFQKCLFFWQKSEILFQKCLFFAVPFLKENWKRTVKKRHSGCILLEGVKGLLWNRHDTKENTTKDNKDIDTKSTGCFYFRRSWYERGMSYYNPWCW